MSRERIAVSLTGGLGNQLFQLAVGLYLVRDSDEKILLETGIGKPRVNIEKNPEIASFILPSNVTIGNRRKGSWLTRKSLGYVLRMGIQPRKFEKFAFVRCAILKISGAISASYFQGKRKVIYGLGIGYFNLEEDFSRQILIGYFQSEYWPNYVYESLMSLSPIEMSRTFHQLLERTNSHKFLAVHIRRGDYKVEDSFGLLSKRYYWDAINEVMTARNYQSIWLFSDNPEEVLDFIPDKFKARIYVVPETLNASETFQLMRYGDSYVIANSTFSWWAAYLSFSSSPIVYAPTPWFNKIDDPARLLPENWIKRSGH